MSGRDFGSTFPHQLKSMSEKSVWMKSHSLLYCMLPSLEQYLTEVEVNTDPSLPMKYKDYLSSTPAIRAALYTTFNAKVSAEVYTV